MVFEVWKRVMSTAMILARRTPGHQNYTEHTSVWRAVYDSRRLYEIGSLVLLVYESDRHCDRRQTAISQPFQKRYHSSLEAAT